MAHSSGLESHPRDSLAGPVADTLRRFVDWLDGFGDSSWDHQSFFAGRFGRSAKALYYRNRLLGTAAVAPMIFCEAFLPAARQLFHHRIRFPIADAHYAMGFWYLYGRSADPVHLSRARAYLDALLESRCPGFVNHCWGYPFNWVTRNGTIARQTPLITTTPYVYEAFRLGYALCKTEAWRDVLQSIARHAFADIKEFPVSATAASCSYTPFDTGGVINAAAYRAFLLTSASHFAPEPLYSEAAHRNLTFVLDAQQPDGSWFYAADGVRDFVDHFHTCFVLKALAKIHTITRDERCLTALAVGLDYYLARLLDVDGLPRPFAKAPRLTAYRRELYDFAECINLCLLLQTRFPQLTATLHRVVQAVLAEWVKPDGSFRSRQLLVGWDNLPMHRWAQAQMFRSLALFLATPAARQVDGQQAVRTVAMNVPPASSATSIV